MEALGGHHCNGHSSISGSENSSPAGVYLAGFLFRQQLSNGSIHYMCNLRSSPSLLRGLPAWTLGHQDGVDPSILAGFIR